MFPFMVQRNPWCNQGPCDVGQVDGAGEDTLLVVYLPINLPARMLAMDFTEQHIQQEEEVQKRKEV